jgi:hypothetical protein
VKGLPTKNNWCKIEEMKPSNQQGVFNENALALAINYEYKSHQKLIDSTGNPPMTAYQ